MDKTNRHMQILDGCLFFSPNCSHMVDLPPPAQDRNGCEHNIFLPFHQPNGCCNYFDLDITKYAIPHWWSLPFGWIAFFPLYPSFSRPIVEKLILPANYEHVFDEEHCEYSLASGLSKKWLQVKNDLSNAVHIICCHNQSLCFHISSLTFWLWLFQDAQIFGSTTYVIMQKSPIMCPRHLYTTFAHIPLVASVLR